MIKVLEHLKFITSPFFFAATVISREYLESDRVQYIRMKIHEVVENGFTV